MLAFHIGQEIDHRDELWGLPVNLDFIFFEVQEMEGYLHEAGFVTIEIVVRAPYPDVEVQTQRAYIFASHP